jgi:hypothetical protein
VITSAEGTGHAKCFHDGAEGVRPQLAASFALADGVPGAPAGQPDGSVHPGLDKAVEHAGHELGREVTHEHVFER